MVASNPLTVSLHLVSALWPLDTKSEICMVRIPILPLILSTSFSCYYTTVFSWNGSYIGIPLSNFSLSWTQTIMKVHGWKGLRPWSHQKTVIWVPVSKKKKSSEPEGVSLLISATAIQHLGFIVRLQPQFLEDLIWPRDPNHQYSALSAARQFCS